jgi:hypothetical protein
MKLGVVIEDRMSGELVQMSEEIESVVSLDVVKAIGENLE